MDDSLSTSINISYLPPTMIGTANGLLLWAGWMLLVIALILSYVSSATNETDERYKVIERTLISKRATSPSSTQKSEKQDEHQECTICQTPMQKGDIVSWSPNSQCCHVYHHGCIKQWLLEHKDCPSCRQSFETCESVTLRTRNSYFCVRDGLQFVSNWTATDERTHLISPEELEQHRDPHFHPLISKAKEQDDSWDNAELLMSYGRHMRLPPV